MYIDSGDSIAQKTGSRKLVKKRSTFCPISKSESSLDYEFYVKNFKIFEIKDDLQPFLSHFEARQQHFMNNINQIFKSDNSLETFAVQYEQYGVFKSLQGFQYREYAPHAIEVYLTGDFNNWNLKEHPLINDGMGLWSITLPQGIEIEHGSKLSAYVRTSKDQFVFRVPIGAKVICPLEGREKETFCEVFWNPQQKFEFQSIHPHKPRSFKIYRAQIGKSSDSQHYNTFKQFSQIDLERIKSLGYNSVLLSGIQEHDQKGSYYSVVSPYAINSVAGTPDDLKELIDKAHQIGLYIIMDIVQSHASPNQGFNEWDGSSFSYFVEGQEGLHPEGGRLFNFAKWETQRLLLSNLGYFLNEYKIDGFRYHDVQSIIFKGVANSLTNLEEKFSDKASLEGLAFLMLANETIHKINSNAVTFAEDLSNYPSLCFPLNQGGIGFDQRISILAADQLAPVLQSQKDNLTSEVLDLLNIRFPEEKLVTSLCFKSSQILLQKALQKDSPPEEFQKGISLHKIARLLALTYGGDSYLNRYGNEFGTSEEFLRLDLLQTSPYKELQEFEKQMLQIEEKHQILSIKDKTIILKHNKLLAYEKGDLLFVFNFGPESFSSYKVGTKWNCEHTIIFSTDEVSFCGLGKVSLQKVPVQNEIISDNVVLPFLLEINIPPFTGIILCPTNTEECVEETNE